MEDKHGEQWRSICRVKGLKTHWQHGDGTERTADTQQSFTMDMFSHNLMTWVAADDRVCGFVAHRVAHSIVY